ncbi:hypothetical protein BLA29_013324, partial [Euroglyphus maynei]
MEEEENANPPTQNQMEAPRLENLDPEIDTNETSRVSNQNSILSSQVYGGDAINNSEQTTVENIENTQLPISFEIVVENIDQADKNEWTKNLVMIIGNRFGGRVPRGGWKV